MVCDCACKRLLSLSDAQSVEPNAPPDYKVPHWVRTADVMRYKPGGEQSDTLSVLAIW